MRKLAIFNIHEKQHLILGDIVVDEGGHILVRGGRHVGSGGVEESKVTQITAAAACYAHTERLTRPGSEKARNSASIVQCTARNRLIDPFGHIARRCITKLVSWYLELRKPEKNMKYFPEIVRENSIDFGKDFGWEYASAFLTLI